MISRKFASVGATGSSCPAYFERGDIVREARRCLYRGDTYRRIYAPLFAIDGETTEDLQDQAQDTRSVRLVRFGASAICGLPARCASRAWRRALATIGRSCRDTSGWWSHFGDHMASIVADAERIGRTGGNCLGRRAMSIHVPRWRDFHSRA